MLSRKEIEQALKYFNAAKFEITCTGKSYISSAALPHVGAAIYALKKQLRQNPDHEADGYDESGNLIYDTAYCPNCGHTFEVDYDATDYCPKCGQALNWNTDSALQSPENIALEDMNISLRSYNCLKSAGINTLQDLSKCTVGDLIRIRGLKQQWLQEVLDKCEEYGANIVNDMED